jgi:hypothetical protein
VDEIDAREVRRLAADHGAVAVATAAAVAEGEPRPVLSTEARETLARYRSGIESAPVFPLTGADLVRRGIPPGPEIGRILAEARQAWMQAGCPPGPPPSAQDREADARAHPQAEREADTPAPVGRTAPE